MSQCWESKRVERGQTLEPLGLNTKNETSHFVVCIITNVTNNVTALKQVFDIE